MKKNELKFYFYVFLLLVAALLSENCQGQKVYLQVVFTEFVEVALDQTEPNAVIYAGNYHEHGLFKRTVTAQETLYVATSTDRYFIVVKPHADRSEKVKLYFENLDYVIEPWEPQIVTF